MRNFPYFFLLTSAFGQTQPLPTVRDAYVQGEEPPRVARLRHNLIVVVCKAEYDTWLKDQKAPALSLYMNGLLMKGPPAVAPVTAKSEQTDKLISEGKADCTKHSDPTETALEKDAADKAALAKAAKESLDKAAKEPEGKKNELKEVSDKAEIAKMEAAKKTIAEKAPVQQIYVTMQYYLDSQFVAKPETKDSWIRLLQRPWENEVPVSVSVGPADGSPWPSMAAIKFQRINYGYFTGWAVLFGLSIGLFIAYARTSAIIRDSGELPAPPPGTKRPLKAYSLARTQMALWTFLVGGALAFLFMVTWNENTISGGVLVLMGISFGTTLMAATADRVSSTPTDITLAEKAATDKAAASKEAADIAAAETDKKQAADKDAADKAAAAKEAADKAAAETDSDKKKAAEKDAADKVVAAKVAANIAAAETIKKQAADKDAADKVADAKFAADKAAALKEGIPQVPHPTKHFLTDLLTEGDGPSFHRYQMVLFTIILAVIFVAKTASTLVMPEFDTMLLGLMGISSGTYLGFKLQGK